MSIELVLWLQDEEVLNDVMDLLQLKENHKDPRTVVGEIRKVLIHNKKDSFDPQNITLWENITSSIIRKEK